MNMGWLAATLSPGDVAPHEDFSGDAITPEGLLGLTVQGRFQALDRRMPDARFPDGPDAEVISLARDLLLVERMEEAARALSLLVAGGDLPDEACATAATLLAVVAFAELDDYDSAIAALDVGLDLVRTNQGPDALLLEAALSQQRALRLAELSGDGLEEARRTVALLASVDIRQLSKFPTSRSVSGGSTATYRNIIRALRSSAEQFIVLAGVIPDPQAWRRFVRAGENVLALRSTFAALSGYMAFVDETFDVETLSRERTWRSEDAVDSPIWRALLNRELLGNRQDVRRLRSQLGQLRFVRPVAEDDTWRQQDAIRFLRHSEDLKRLNLALSKLRASGPLAALARDARRVIGRRLAPERLRDFELRAC